MHQTESFRAAVETELLSPQRRLPYISALNHKNNTHDPRDSFIGQIQKRGP